jgi:hypothetical protein
LLLFLSIFSKICRYKRTRRTFPPNLKAGKIKTGPVNFPESQEGRKMKFFLLRSWVLTDELPLRSKGTPVLIDIETRRIYQRGDRIMGVSAQQVVSLAVEAMGENYLLPEQMRFISRFTSADLPSQWGHEPPMGNVKKLTYEEMQFLMRG